MLDGRYIATNIAGIGILGNQPQCDFFAATTDEEWNVGLLHALWLVDCPIDAVIFSLEIGFFLRPHRQDDLDGFAQAFQALSCARIGIAVGEVFVFVPASANAQNESSMTERIYGRGHFRQQSRVAIAIARD